MSEELKPCPFCGSEAFVVDCWEGIHGMNFYVLCQKCRITLSSSDGFMPKNFTSAKAAERAWNRRAEVKE